MTAPPWTWQDAKIVAWDLETSGTLPEYALQPWRLPHGQAWITSTSMIRHDGKRLVTHGSKLFPTTDDLRQFLEQAIAEDWTVIGWNVTFDIMWLVALGLGDLAHKVRWLDAMLLWRHFEIEPEYEFQSQQHKKRRYRLKPEGHERFMPLRLGRHEDIDFHSTDPEMLKKLQAYNDDDSVDTWIIGAVCWDGLTPAQQQAAHTEAACLSLVAEANYTGMLVDTLACRELGSHLDQVACDMLSQLAPYGVTEKVVRSPKQLAKLMFEDWKLPVLKEGKSGPSTDKEVLHELAFTDPRAKQIRAYREALGNRAKFSEGILKSVAYNGDGRTRPGAIVFGTYSGRMTYTSKQGRGKDERPTGFPLHQEKRDDLYRSAIVAPPGYDLVEFDAANQEFRWMAVAADDPTMLQLCLPGEDAHAFMGSRVVGDEYAELMRKVAEEEASKTKGPASNARQLGKVGNLSLQYRTSARKLKSVARVQYNIPIELPEAQRIHATYQRTYRQVPVYWNRQIALTRQRGFVETFAGRRVQVVGNWDGDWGWSMGSTAINYRIQGTGADQKYLALKVIKDYLVGIGGQFAWELHDGIYFYVPSAKTDRALVDIKQLLDNLPYQEAWGFTPPIPMPWDAKRGSSWGTLKKVNFA